MGPILFNIYIDDIDDGINSKISKFADDTKIANIVNNKNDSIRLQSDINRLMEWADKWQMKFNVDKCKVMHIGKQNNNFVYKMANQPLVSVKEEKDLGVIITNDLKTTKQSIAASNKANRMLGLIKRSMDYKSDEVIKKTI